MKLCEKKSPHELIIFTKFHEDRIKNVDFYEWPTFERVPRLYHLLLIKFLVLCLYLHAISINDLIDARRSQGHL